MKIIGQGMDRTDGRLKVTGGATYSAEHAVPRLAQAVMVQSTIPSGRIVAIDDAAARAMPGVLLVMTHLNAPPRQSTLRCCRTIASNTTASRSRWWWPTRSSMRRMRRGSCGVRYAAKPAVLSFQPGEGQSCASRRRRPVGRFEPRQCGRRHAPVRGDQIDAVYTTPLESHNPMEPHATIAAWDGDTLTLYDSTQSIAGVRKAAAKTLGIAAGQGAGGLPVRRRRLRLQGRRPGRT